MVTDNVDEPTTATTTVPRRPAAQVLFGDDAPAPPPAAKSELEAWSPNRVEVELYGLDYPAPTEVFSVETAVRPALRQREPELMTVLGMGQAERIQRHREFVAAIRESGVDPNSTGQQLYNLMTDAQIAAAHGRDLDDSQAAPMFESINGELLARYGPERGERLVKAVGTFVETHPGLARVLGTPGIATRFGFKETLHRIVEHVRVQGNL